MDNRGSKSVVDFYEIFAVKEQRADGFSNLAFKLLRCALIRIAWPKFIYITSRFTLETPPRPHPFAVECLQSSMSIGLVLLTIKKLELLLL